MDFKSVYEWLLMILEKILIYSYTMLVSHSLYFLVSISVCLFLYTLTHAHINAHIYTHIHIHTCVYVYIGMYICTFTISHISFTTVSVCTSFFNMVESWYT